MSPALKWLVDLLAMIVAGSPLLLVIMAIVEGLKRLGVSGRGLFISSLITGLIIGSGYQLSLKIPAAYPEWFELVISSLVWGLAACGLFEAIKAATAKGALLAKRK